MAVIAEAFSSASSSPVAALNSSTLPWCASLPMAVLPGNTQTAFKPYSACVPAR
jgi:hypothetical protein